MLHFLHHPVAGKCWATVTEALNRLESYLWAYITIDPRSLGGLLDVFVFLGSRVSDRLNTRYAAKAAYLHPPGPQKMQGRGAQDKL